VSLLTELDGFSTEHHHCGDMDAGVEGPIVWIACDCGAGRVRRVDEDDDAVELELDARGRRLRGGARRRARAGPPPVSRAV
jgi:hypothetical protein